MRFAIDLDNVVFDFVGAWHSCAEQVLQRPLSAQGRTYHLARLFGLSDHDAHMVWAAFHLQNRWAWMHPLPGAVETLRMLLYMEHDLVYVTRIPFDRKGPVQSIVDARHANLSRHGIDAPVLPVAESKAEVLQSLLPHFFADDRWPHCLEARNVLVPYIACIQSVHDGDGAPVLGVHSHASLQEAVAGFSEVMRQGNLHAPSLEWPAFR